MDGFTEKKWFLYLTDHHEGPFSLDDIQSKLQQAEVTGASFVWADGMSDWAMMSDIPTFEPILIQPLQIKTPPPPAPEESSPSIQITTLEPVHIVVNSDRPEHAIPGIAADTPVAKRRSPIIFIAALTLIISGLAVVSAYTLGMIGPKGGKTVEDLTQPYLMTLADAVPVFGKWISPIPHLDDVLPDEYEELKAAAKVKPETGVKASLALSQADVFFPTFYIASNLPDEVVFDLVIEGIPETLLNQTSFNARLQATQSKHLAKTPAFKFQETKPIPRGDYIFYLVVSDTSPTNAKAAASNVSSVTSKLPLGVAEGTKILATRTYFLGGKKDAIYTARLKEFHDRLKEKASAELAEIKQFTSVLETELGQTGTKFRAFSTGRKISPAQRKAWTAYDQEWGKLSQQLNQNFSKWTPDALNTQYFYGVLYQLVQAGSQAVERVHSIHNSFFSTTQSPLDRNTFEVQVGEAMSFAQNAINVLKVKMDQAEKIPPTPNGMPRKDGL